MKTVTYTPLLGMGAVRLSICPPCLSVCLSVSMCLVLGGSRPQQIVLKESLEQVLPQVSRSSCRGQRDK